MGVQLWSFLLVSVWMISINEYVTGEVIFSPFVWIREDKLKNAAGAVFGGIENNFSTNRTLAVAAGRALYNGHYVPCKAKFDHFDAEAKDCRFADGEHEKTVYYGYEYLTYKTHDFDKFSWVRVSSSVLIDYFESIVVVDDDVPLYGFGRAAVDGVYKTIGKVNLETKLLETTYMGYKTWNEYEVLLWDQDCVYINKS